MRESRTNSFLTSGTLFAVCATAALCSDCAQWAVLMPDRPLRRSVVRLPDPEDRLYDPAVRAPAVPLRIGDLPASPLVALEHLLHLAGETAVVERQCLLRVVVHGPSVEVDGA